MKIKLCIILASVMGAVSLTSAQITFTRVTGGEIAEDAGHFGPCSWGDYDNDGLVDLIVTPGKEGPNRLYHNEGEGYFTRVVTGAIPEDSLTNSNGPVWGDWDNDGDLDLFVASYGNSDSPPSERYDRFYRNEGDGTFTKITEGWWVNGPYAGVSSAWADYDNDGFLDLYVCNSFSRVNSLHRNNGDGTMTPVFGDPTMAEKGSHGCTWGDYDNDGHVDLFVAGQESMQFRNSSDGTLTRVTTGAPDSMVVSDQGIALGDYDNDGDLDLVVTSWGEGDRLYRNDLGSGFVKITDDEIASAAPGDSRTPVWGDLDNDGYLDLFICRGGNEPNLLYHNQGDGTFLPVPDSLLVSDLGNSLGCALADYDNDGDLDLVVSDGHSFNRVVDPAPVALYQNDESTNSWLLIHLEGVVSNRSAIGAKVRVKATINGKTVTQLREISGGSGYGSQNDLRAHFGLGDATTVDTVCIEWPSGWIQELTEVSANQILEVEEELEEYDYEISDGTVTITRYNGPGGAVTIPTTIEGLPVTSIGEDAFRGRSSLASVTIPDSVTTIRGYAFSECSSLTSVTIPDSVTEIGYCGFHGCTSLTNVTLGNGVTGLDELTFGDCTSLTSVTIGYGLSYFEQSNFWGCTNLTAITVNGLNSAYSSVDGVLFDKSQTALIWYPQDRAGAYTIPDSVTSIGWSALIHCTSLTSVTIGYGLISIDSYTFVGCTSLAEIAVDAANPAYSSVDGVLFDKSQTTLIKYPSGRAGAFTIPNSVTSIGEDAFHDRTSLTSVTIPDSVTSIGDHAFSGCTSLTILFFQENAPILGDDVFSETNNATAYYLAGTTGWGESYGGRPTRLTTGALDPLIGGLGLAGVESWFVSGWFGFFSTAFTPWLFHIDHGLIYHNPGSTNQGMFVYDDAMATWWWTNESVYPFIYAFDPPADNEGTDIEAEWLWYFEETNSPRSFGVVTGDDAGAFLFFGP